MKKGFTLIELLAVIVILAIIALIAVPLIINMIEESRIKSAVVSGRNYVKAVNYKIAQDALNDKITPSGEYVIGENELEVTVNNIETITGSYEINEKGVLTAGLCINKYSIEYSNGKTYHKKDVNYCSGGYVFEEPEAELLSNVCKNESKYSETKFKIKTVEDLVCLSNLVNGGKDFSGKEIYLLSDIDFNNDSSYKNKSTTDYGDINGNGTVEELYTELTTGKGFKPIGNNSKRFAGTFLGYAYTISNLMINRDTQYLGLFGYNAGTISGLKLKDATITSTAQNQTSAFVGGVVGYNTGTVKNIDATGTVSAKIWEVGGVVGHNESGAYASDLLFSGTVSAPDSSYVGGLVGSNNNGTIKGGVYNTTVTAGTGNVGRLVGTYNSGNTSGFNYNSTHTGSYTTNGTTLSGFTLEGVDGMLDTYIGGDNNSDGYYFDYDNDGNIVLYSAERVPIQNKLKGEGTQENPYLINNNKDWKMASATVTQGKYYTVTSDIDFDGKKFYVLGTNSNRFNGHINGNMHVISNIEIIEDRYTGVFGYNTGVVEGLEFDNITVNATGAYASVIAGYNSGTINGIKLRNMGLTSTFNTDTEAYAGSIAGYNTGTIKNTDVRGTVTGKKWDVGGVVGYNNSGASVLSSLFSGTVLVPDSSYVGGLIGLNNNGTVKGGVYNTTVTAGTGNVGRLVGSYNSGNTSGFNYNSTHTGSYTTNGTTLSGFTLEGVDGMLDTYIGGDNDSDGYYFDYDSNGEIVLFSNESTPIVNSLKGNGTQDSPYQIASANDWKMASATVTQGKYYTVTSDIDFDGKKFYVLGTNSNRFNGHINGNMHVISNIEIIEDRYTGVFGYNTGTIEGLEFDDITVNATGAYASVIAGYNSGTINGIKLRNMALTSTFNTDTEAYAGSIAGYNNGTIKNTDVRGTVTGKKWDVGGVVGYNNSGASILKAVFSGTVIVPDSSYVGGIAGLNNNGTIKGGVYNTTVTAGTGNVGRLVGSYNSANTTGFNYNSTHTGSYTTNGTTLSELTPQSVSNVLDITDTDGDGYYFEVSNNSINLLASN